MSDPLPTTQLSEDGLHLVVRFEAPGGGIRELTAIRHPRVGPFTPADIALVVADAATLSVDAGQRSSTRNVGRWLQVHVSTGPPTWWYPHAQYAKRTLMVGWFRALIAVTVRAHPRARRS